MRNLTYTEVENEVLRDRYLKLKKAATTLAKEVEEKLCYTENRAVMFEAVKDIKTLTK